MSAQCQQLEFWEDGERGTVVLSAGSKSENSISLWALLLFKRHKKHYENKRGNVACMDVYVDICVFQGSTSSRPHHGEKLDAFGA